jgi:hypothetical protein
VDGAATFTKGPSTKLRESTSSVLATKLQAAIPEARLTGSSPEGNVNVLGIASYCIRLH